MLATIEVLKSEKAAMHSFHSKVVETMRNEYDEDLAEKDAMILQLCVGNEVSLDRLSVERSVSMDPPGETPRVGRTIPHFYKNQP